MSRYMRLHKALTVTFMPQVLEIIDESHRHKGHAGQPAQAEETHFRIIIQSPMLASLTRVQQQRLLNQALAEEWAAGLHSVSWEVKK